jgi:hypothetical protein
MAVARAVAATATGEDTGRFRCIKCKRGRVSGPKTLCKKCQKKADLKRRRENYWNQKDSEESKSTVLLNFAPSG